MRSRLLPRTRAAALVCTMMMAASAVGAANAGCGGDGGVVATAGTQQPDGGADVGATDAKVVAFTAAQEVIDFGASTTLTWQIEGAVDDLTIDGVSVLGKSELLVKPVRRQTFTLRALSGGRVVGTRAVSVAARGIDVLGGDPRGASSFDGPAEVAGFASPYGVALDSAGNAYVADFGNREIRRVGPDGTVTTLAGDPHAPREVVDGVGKSAHFTSPSGIAVDSNGVVYVSELFSHVVRKMLPDGTVTTLAGKAGEPGTTNAVGANARFNAPMGLLVLPSGELLVADNYNCVVRKIGIDATVSTAYGVMGSCVISNVAPAKFQTPNWLARDTAGNLYVSDRCQVRQITPGGAVSTYAGTSACGNVDTANAGAQFGSIDGIAVDAAGNVFVADYGGRSVRKITPTKVTTLAGSATAIGDSDGPSTYAGFYRAAGIAARPNGDLVVGDYYGNTLRSIRVAGEVTTLAGTRLRIGTQDGPVGQSRFQGVQGVTVDADGNVVVTDIGGASIRRVSREGIVSTLAGGGGEGALDGIGPDARFSRPTSITGDTKGTYWIGDLGSSTVRKLDPNGTVTTVAGLPGVSATLDGAKGVGSFATPTGLVRDSKGNIFVVQYGKGIRKVAPDGTLSTLAGLATPDGHLDGDLATAKFNGPRAIAIDAADNLYIGDSGNYVVRKITPDGKVSTVAGTPTMNGYVDGPGAQAKFGFITGVAVDAKGNIFVADSESDAIRKIAPDQNVSTVVGTRGIRGSRSGLLPGTLFSPNGVAVTAEGDLIVTTNSAVMQVTAP